MKIPEPIILALDQALARRSNKRPAIRRSFIRGYLQGTYTLTQLAESTGISTVTASTWRRILRETMTAHRQPLPNEPGAQPTRDIPLPPLDDSEEESATFPDTDEEPTKEPAKKFKSKKPYLDNDTFRSYMDDLIVNAADAEDPKTFQAIGRMKIDTTPGLKVPDTHININITYLGPQGLDALDAVVTDRVLRLAKMADKLPSELQQAIAQLGIGQQPMGLDPKKELIPMLPAASSDPSSTEEAGRYVADTDVSDEDDDN